MATAISRDSTTRTATRTEDRPKTVSRTTTTARPVGDATPSTRVTARTASGNAVVRDGGTTSDARTATGVRATPTTAMEARRIQSFDPRVAQLRGRADSSLGVGTTSGTNATVADGTTRALGTRTATPNAINGNARTAQTRRAFGLGDPMSTPFADAGIGGAIGAAAGAAAAATPTEGFTTNRDGSHTFNGTSGDDRYTVSQGTDGSVTVRNTESGSEYALTADEAKNGVTINGGAGDDTITVARGVSRDLTINGGAGNDRLYAGQATGKMTLRGGAGDDTIAGGRGNDDISGGLGADTIRGGAGMDRLAGNGGDDRIDGGAGDDQLLGQGGDDRITGSSGHDLIQGGDGADAVNGGTGGDAIYGDEEDTIDAGTVRKGGKAVADEELDLVVLPNGAPEPTNLGANDHVVRYDPATVDAWLKDHPEVRITGNSDFVARTTADLGVMLSTEQGRGLLGDLTTALDGNGETLAIQEKTEGPGGTYNFGTNIATVGNYAAQYGDGTNRMPLPALFHELVHSYQDLVSGAPSGSSSFGGGGEARNLERQTTGLPWMDEHGTVHGPNDLPYSDNLFRRELGLPERTTYSGESGDPTGYVADTGDGHDHEH
jgi:Ca2+-binding RTX toxin-like protein